MKWYQKKYFFGWSNIKYLLTQIYFTFSNKPSELSRKRIESCLIFVSTLTASMTWFFIHIKELTYVEVIAFVTTHFAYAGYILNSVQKEKLKLKLNGNNTEEQKS